MDRYLHNPIIRVKERKCEPHTMAKYLRNPIIHVKERKCEPHKMDKYVHNSIISHDVIVVTKIILLI